VTREELEHVIRAACDVAGDDAVYVFGSQAILGQFPEAPAALRQSVEADVAPRTRLDRIDQIDGSLGEFSLFHRTFHIYVHGLAIEAAKLPSGWKQRVIPVCNEGTHWKTGDCLEAHDLAASKLVAFREKDTDFVRVLLTEHLIDPKVLTARIESLEVPDELRQRIVEWVLLTASPPKA
jgi:hypothetical protein